MADLMERVALLLNQAENAATEGEREAFWGKAQTLATNYQIDVAEAQAKLRDKTKRQVPEQRKITIAAGRGDGRRRGENNAAEKVFLFTDIAKINDVQCNIAHNSTYVIAFGFGSDIDLVEALYASLVLQMVRSCEEVMASGEYKKETREVFSRTEYRYVTKPMDGRVFRTSFYESFRRVVVNRLHQARQETLQQRNTAEGKASGPSVDLVLVDKTRQVSDFYRRNSGARGTYKGGRRNSYSSNGWTAGAASGMTARLSSATPLPAGRKAVR